MLILFIWSKILKTCKNMKNSSIENFFKPKTGQKRNIIENCNEPKTKKIKEQKHSFRTIFDNEKAQVFYYENFLDKKDADILFKELTNNIAWEQEKIVLFGNIVEPSRLTSSNGDVGLSYSYSGTKKISQGWNTALDIVRKQVEDVTGHKYNFALLNKYRDGSDSVGAHSDSEKDLNLEAGIASISLGAERDFLLHPKEKPTDAKKRKATKVILQSGSLLVMSGNCQKNYKHSVPKRPKILDSRINITFRSVNT